MYSIPINLIYLYYNYYAIFLQFGGITTLGVNTVLMGLPAVVCYHLFAPFLKRTRVWALSAAFAGGSLSVLFSGLLVGLALMSTEEGFLRVAQLVVAAHVPIMIIEGVVTAFVVGFLRRVQPDLLPGPPPLPGDG